jgi:hypothetical protein
MHLSTLPSLVRIQAIRGANQVAWLCILHRPESLGREFCCFVTALEDFRNFSVFFQALVLVAEHKQFSC